MDPIVLCWLGTTFQGKIVFYIVKAGEHVKAKGECLGADSDKPFCGLRSHDCRDRQIVPLTLFGIILTTTSHFYTIYSLRRLDPTFPTFIILTSVVWILCTTMIIYRLHFVYIILLLVNFSSGRKTIIARAADDFHQMAVHHTHNLARDLRIAFGGYLTRRASNDNQHVVYCKRGDQSPLVDGGSGNVSISKSPATATRSSSTPKATSTSSWKLTKSYVCHNEFKLLTLFFT